MGLASGTKLGPYEIQSPLGAGGMGEVYRARDTRLDRTVAIKILPSHLSGNPEAKQRFDREARAISSLNHPNICTLHDIGHHGSGAEEVLLEGSDQLRYPTGWSPDGKFLTYREPQQGVWAVWMLPLTGERKPYAFLHSQFGQSYAVFSPDSKWVTYCSNESGEFKVYVVPFPGSGR